MIQEGCDAGVVVGELTDDSVVARPVGKIARYVAASPEFLKGRAQAKEPSDLKSWPWVALSGAQFGGSKTVTLHCAKKADQIIAISPLLISEGVTSLREAVLSGLGIGVLADWLIREDIASGRLVRVLPQWNAKEFPVHVVYPGHRMLPVRVRAFVDFAVPYMASEVAPRS